MTMRAARPGTTVLLRRVVLWTVLATPLAGGCGPRAEEPPPATVAVLDSFLLELGHLPTASLIRSQRWRMISSIWVGLPPPGYSRDSLPEPRSDGAALLQTYCEQCHWMPSPRMHAAEEWPLLVRRMVLRARTVQERMGGPLTEEIVGSERLLEGMGVARLPSPEEEERLVLYLQAHALPTAAPGELGEGPEARLFERRCSVCHETPSPTANTAEEWPATMARMTRNMSVMGVQPLPAEEMERLLRFARTRATR